MKETARTKLEASMRPDLEKRIRAELRAEHAMNGHSSP